MDAPSPILSRFIDHESSAAWMRKPVAIDGRWFATDGKIAAWHVAGREVATSPEIPKGSVDGLRRVLEGRAGKPLVPGRPVRDAMRAALLSGDRAKACDGCRGGGKVSIEKCKDCGGSGACHHCDRECLVCDWRGERLIPGGPDACSECDGRGAIFRGVISVAGVGMGSGYVHTLIDLGADVGAAYHQGKQRCFPWSAVSDGTAIEGIVMECVLPTEYRGPVIDLPVGAIG